MLERGQGEPPTTSGTGQAALRTPASAVKGRSAEKSVPGCEITVAGILVLNAADKAAV